MDDFGPPVLYSSYRTALAFGRKRELEEQSDHNENVMYVGTQFLACLKVEILQREILRKG